MVCPCNSVGAVGERRGRRRPPGGWLVVVIGGWCPCFCFSLSPAYYDVLYAANKKHNNQPPNTPPKASEATPTSCMHACDIESVVVPSTTEQLLLLLIGKTRKKTVPRSVGEFFDDTQLQYYREGGER